MKSCKEGRRMAVSGESPLGAPWERAGVYSSVQCVAEWVGPLVSGLASCWPLLPFSAPS